MPTIEYRLKPQGETLEAFMLDRSRCSFIMGPLGSGKTYQCCQKLFKLICEQEPTPGGIRKSRWCAVRNTYPDLTTTTIKDWRDLFGDLGRYKHGGMEPPTHRMYFQLEDGTFVESELVFLALDRDDAIKRLRGQQFTGFWLNEAKELSWQIVQMLDLRHGRYPSAMDGGPSWHGMIGDTNAPDEDNWYYQLAELGKVGEKFDAETNNEDIDLDDWKFYRQPGGVIKVHGKWVPNPKAENLPNLPPNYYKKGMQAKDDDWIAVNLGNEYGTVKAGKPVYEKQWIDSLHVAPAAFQPIKGLEVIVGMDFGLTPSAIFAQVTPTGQLRIIEEVLADGFGIRQFIKNMLRPVINARYQGCKVTLVCDPAGNNRDENNADTAIGILQSEGFNAIPASTNNIEPRLEAVRYFLGQLGMDGAVFQLSPACKVLRKGFNTGYSYRKLKVSGETRYTAEPEKNKFSHPHDGLQYLCLHLRGAINQPSDEDISVGAGYGSY